MLLTLRELLYRPPGTNSVFQNDRPTLYISISTKQNKIAMISFESYLKGLSFHILKNRVL